MALIELLAAILRVITQERVCGSKGNTRTKNFELCQTRVEGKNESRIYIYLRFSFTQTLSEKNNHKQVLNLRPWFATNTKQRYLYRSQTRRATTFQSCPSGDTCSTCMSIPRPYLRGGLFIFTEYILVVRDTYIYVHTYVYRRRVPNHKPVWELHISATPPALFLLSIESTTNLVGHNIFTSIRDRHKNINF